MTIKDQIREKKSIEVEKYTLKKGSHALTDTKTIRESGIKNGDTVKVDYNTISITVNALGKTISMSVDPDNKVSTIRTELKNTEGIEGAYQLTLAGQKVDETKTINNAGIKEGSVIVVDYTVITLKVKIGTKTIDVQVDPDNKVSTIKDAIKEKEGVEQSAITLKKGSETLDGEKTIQGAGLKEGTEITADFTAISVTVDIDGKKVEVSVDPDNKVSAIKEKIKAKEDIDASRYKLVKGGETLDEGKTIHNSGIKAGATLTADFNTISIKVKLGTKTLDIDVDPDNKVETIKTAIKEKEPEAGAYTLKKGETTLDLQKTIYAAGIRAGSTITADFNSIKVTVEVGSEEYELEVDPDEKVSTIKDKLKE
jgi:hypothetical protein